MKDRINNITGILYYGLKCRYFISRSGMVFKCEDNVKDTFIVTGKQPC